jgi:Ca2+-transporting ATPase
VQAVLRGGSLAGNAQLRQALEGTGVIQGDPTEAAFLVAARKLGQPADRDASASASASQGGCERIGEIPFTSQRKMMSVLGSGRRLAIWNASVHTASRAASSGFF